MIFVQYGEILAHAHALHSVAKASDNMHTCNRAGSDKEVNVKLNLSVMEDDGFVLMPSSEAIVAKVPSLRSTNRYYTGWDTKL